MATKKTGAAAAGEKKAAAKRPAAKKTAAEKPAAKRPAAKKPAARKIPEKPRILLVAGECNPFSQTGGLGEVASSLPIAVNELGTAEMAVVTPLYECVGEQYRKDFQFICHINVPVAWRSQYAGLFKYIYRGVTYYFIDNEYYFKRGGLYGYYDDAERFAFFCRAVLELMPYMDFKPDVIHANDWHTALVPIYYKLYYMYAEGDAYSYIQNLFTIHNIEYQGREVTFTQACYLIGSLFLMMCATTITSCICFAFVDPSVTELTYGELILLNLGAFITLFAISGINFLTSCWFDRSKRSMALGGGFSMFFLVATMLGLFGFQVIPSVVRLDALNNFNYVSLITLFDSVSIISGTTTFIWKLAILFVIGLVGYVIGSIRFKKKDLPL